MRAVRPGVRERLGALHERDFRLLFGATIVTTFGDAVATIALTFAVLRTLHGSATQLGIVLAVRLVASSVVLLAGGVLSDRVPRHLVIVGASVVQGGAQTATAALLLSGHGSIAALAFLQVLYGVGDGFVLPAEVGLVPQTVTPERLQQANALQGMSRNVVYVVGPAIGGALVVAGSPGFAIAVDAASFFVCALVLARIRIAPLERAESPSFLHELCEGWREFASRTWLWSTVVLFGVGNVFFMFWTVLGPTVVNARLGDGGPRAWTEIVVASGLGALVGGAVALRYRPARPLVACIVTPATFPLQLLALAFAAPVWLVAAAAFASGMGIAVHLALWFTIFQQEVPEHARSRVSSYDMLGSFVLNPLGAAIAGPVAAGIGTKGALLLAVAVIGALNVVMLLIPSVWSIRRHPAATTMAAV